MRKKLKMRVSRYHPLELSAEAKTTTHTQLLANSYYQKYNLYEPTHVRYYMTQIPRLQIYNKAIHKEQQCATYYAET